MLYMSDLDSTLIKGYMDSPNPQAAFDEVVVLPHRMEWVERVAQLSYTRIALVTNQAGVAFGHVDEDRVWAKLGAVCAAFRMFLGLPFSVHVCFTHPRASVAQYRRDDDRRKPGSGMLQEAMIRHNTSQLYAMYVGDMDSDRQAADAAGVAYVDAVEFFGD